MSLLRLLMIGLLAAAAFALVSALATRNGVGALEYVAGAGLALGLVLLAARLTLKARIG